MELQILCLGTTYIPSVEIHKQTIIVSCENLHKIPRDFSCTRGNGSLKHSHLGGESYFLEHSDERDIRLISADVVSFWCPGVKNYYPRTRRAQDTGFQKKSLFLKKSLRKIAVRADSDGDF